LPLDGLPVSLPPTPPAVTTLTSWITGTALSALTGLDGSLVPADLSP